MIHPEIEKIDNQVQTSLEDISPETRAQFEEELHKLREDKSLLEGKIRGYLTLSDICREYKEELSKLRQDYNRLQERVNAENSFNRMTSQLSKNESPTPDNDLGTVKGHEHEQRTQTHDPNFHYHQPQSPHSRSINNFESVASNILKGNEVPVRTKDLFDLVEDPPKSSEGTKSMPHSLESASHYQDKYPMQESMAAESSSKSITGVGFEHVPSDDMALGQSAGNKGFRQPGDLMNFSVTQSKSQHADDDQELENILKSVQLDSRENVDLKKVVTTIKSYANSNSEKLQKTNAVLVDMNKENQRKIKNLEDEIKRLKKVIQEFEQAVSRSMTPKDSSNTGGWVHVQKQSESEAVTKTTEFKQRSTSDNEEIETLRQKNHQLTEANQRWSNEWNKLVAHYDSRINDLQTERDRLAKEMTENKISEEAKLRDFEKMLMNSKKKASEEEMAKEEAFLQVTSANNRADALQLQLQESEDTNTALRREKQVLETELSVMRQRPVTSSGRAQQGPRNGRSQMDLDTENDVLRQQLLVFQEDFDRERQDRAKAQSLKDEYKKQNEQYKKRARHLEQKVQNLDRQVKMTEDSSKKYQEEKIALQQENSNLKLQLQREQEKLRNYIPSQMAYQQPLVQSAGLQPQRQVIFGQQVPQPRQQQYHIPPTYDQQRVPQLQVGYNVQAPGSQYSPSPQGVYSPPAPYYQANQAGRQTEYKPGSWACDQCTYTNYPGRTVCELCGYIRSPSATQQNNFAFRPTGNETLHARGDPQQQQQQQQQQQPPYGYGGSSAQRDVTTDNMNYMQ